MIPTNTYFTLANEQACIIPDTENQYAVTETGKVYSMRYNRFLKTLVNERGYRAIRLPYGSTVVHKLVAKCFISNPQNKPFVDHIDRDRLNNHFSNLRWATYEENNFNKTLRISSKTGYTGVTQKPDGKFIARISINKKQVYIGRFDSAELAAKAYDEAAKQNPANIQRNF